MKFFYSKDFLRLITFCLIHVMFLQCHYSHVIWMENHFYIPKQDNWQGFVWFCDWFSLRCSWLTIFPMYVSPLSGKSILNKLVCQFGTVQNILSSLCTWCKINTVFRLPSHPFSLQPNIKPPTVSQRSCLLSRGIREIRDMAPTSAPLSQKKQVACGNTVTPLTHLLG